MLAAGCWTSEEDPPREGRAHPRRQPLDVGCHHLSQLPSQLFAQTCGFGEMYGSAQERMPPVAGDPAAHMRVPLGGQWRQQPADGGWPPFAVAAVALAGEIDGRRGGPPRGSRTRTA